MASGRKHFTKSLSSSSLLSVAFWGFVAPHQPFGSLWSEDYNWSKRIPLPLTSESELAQLKERTFPRCPSPSVLPRSSRSPVDSFRSVSTPREMPPVLPHCPLEARTKSLDPEDWARCLSRAEEWNLRWDKPIRKK